MKKESEILKARAYKACSKIVASLDKANDLRVMPVYDSKDFVIMPREAWDNLSKAIQDYDNMSEKLGLTSIPDWEYQWAKVFCLAEVLVNDKTLQIPTVNDLQEFQNAMDVFCKDAEYIVIHINDEPDETYNKVWQGGKYMDYRPRYMNRDDYDAWTKLFPDNWV